MKELNEENVKEIFNEAIQVNTEINDESEKSELTSDLPVLFFNRDIIDKEYGNLKDMFEQTKVISEHMDVFSFKDGIVLDNGEYWTGTNGTVLNFYYLLNAAKIIGDARHTRDGKTNFTVLAKLKQIDEEER